MLHQIHENSMSMPCPSNAPSMRETRHLGESPTPAVPKKKGTAKEKVGSESGKLVLSKKAASIVTYVMKWKKKGIETNPLFVCSPYDAYGPYFKGFESKWSPNFTAVENLVFCKTYAAVSEDPTVGIDQMAVTFCGGIWTTM